MQISAEGGRKWKNWRDLLLTYEKPIQNQVIQLSWTAMIFDTNTIANYDQDIIPFLNSPFNLAFIRDPITKKFVKEKLTIGRQ
jgi:hypothetical protein